MMKKILRLVILSISASVLLVALYNNASASSGYLKAASIKTCPNGSTYGYHGSDNHWHLATYSESDGRWRATGSPLSGDPCPSSGASGGSNSSNSGNSGSSSSSNSSSNSGNSSSSSGASGGSNSSNSGNSGSSSSSNSSSNSGNSSSSSGTPSNNGSNISGASSNSSNQNSGVDSNEEATKSSDTTIKSLKINKKDVSLSADTFYFALEDDLLESIDIQLNDLKASYIVSEYDSDFSDKNSAQKIKITVTAENGSRKDYFLDVVKKIPSVGLNVWFKEDTSQVKISESEGKYNLESVAFWQGQQCFMYELTGEDASVETSINGQTITDCAKLNIGSNELIFKVVNKYGDINEIPLIIRRNNLIATIIVDIIFGVLFIASMAAMGYLIKYLWQKYGKAERKRSTAKRDKINFKDLALKVYVPPFVVIKGKKTNKKSSNWLIAWCAVWIFLVVAWILAISGSSAEISRNPSDYIKNPKYYSFLVEYSDAPVVEEQEESSQEGVSSSGETSTSSDVNTGGDSASSGGVSSGNSGGDVSSNTGSSSESNEASVSSPTSSLNNNPMSGIIIAEATNDAYVRNDYQPNWNVGGGCNIRARILQSTSLVDFQTSSNGCTVIYGSWKDPYTGQTLTGNPYQGDGTANDLDIDHIIPLKYVNSHGGSSWSSSQKRTYGASLSAMNNGVYLAVSASENRKKGDKGPSEYYPPNSAYRCTYAQKWRDIARLYSIALSSADYNVVKNVLESCGIQ